MESVSFAQVGLFLACLGAAAGVALVLKSLFRREPALHHEFASKAEHDAFVRKMDEELGRERGARKKIHEEIATLGASLSALQADSNTQTAGIEELRAQHAATQQRIDQIPMRTIQLLKDTRDLHKP